MKGRIWSCWVSVLITFALAIAPSMPVAATTSARLGLTLVPVGTILFSSDYGNTSNWDLYTMNADGSGVTNITKTQNVVEQWPEWSPDGTKVVFRTGNGLQGALWEIWTMNADGSNRKQLTNNAWADEAPHWSPNGKRIIYSSNKNDPNPNCRFDPCNWDIYVMRANGTHVRRLTKDASGDLLATYSPDMSTIAFGSDRGGMQAIYLMNPDGSNVRMITDPALNANEPKWSPDGTKIAFIDNWCDCGPSHIWTMRGDGSDPRQLTNVADRDDHGLTWSPDATRIAFGGQTGGGQGDIEIYSIKTNGDGLRDLTNNPSFWQIEPSWKA